MPAYATYSDLEASLDANVIAQLCSDTGTSNPSGSSIAVALLGRASSIVQAYARVGNIYTDLDLNTLASNKDGLLIMITTGLAAELLFQRRAMKIPPAVEAQLTQVKAMLEALRDGKMIFGNLSKAANAGVGEVSAVSANNLSWYNNMSSSAFFKPRTNDVYRGG
jgi:hypothetical protein